MQDLTDKDKQMMKTVGHQLFRTFMDSLEIKHCNSLFKRGYLLKGIEGGRVFFYCQSVFLNKFITMKHTPPPRPKKKPLSKSKLKALYLKAHILVKLCEEDVEVF